MGIFSYIDHMEIGEYQFFAIGTGMLALYALALPALLAGIAYLANKPQPKRDWK